MGKMDGKWQAESNENMDPGGRARQSAGVAKLLRLFRRLRAVRINLLDLGGPTMVLAMLTAGIQSPFRLNPFS